MTLAASWILFAAATAAAPSNPFAGCRVTAAGRDKVQVACADGTLDVTDGGTADNDDYRRGLITGLHNTARQPVEESEAVLAVPGGKLAATRLVAAQQEVWFVASAPRAEGKRLLMCHEGLSPGGRCELRIGAALAWKWRTGPGAEVPRDIHSPALAGRAVTPPAGCDVAPAPGSTTIQCADASLFVWVDLAPGSTWSAKERASTMAPGKPLSSAGCMVEGIATRCWIAAVQPGTSFRFIISEEVQVRGQRLAVACFAIAESLPPACRESLTMAAP
jgi:hypothetical protein